MDRPVNLRPMTDAEWAAFAQRSVHDFAQELIKAGVGMPHEARAKAEEGFAQLVPDGRRTAGQYFFVAEVGGKRVGRLWLGERDDGPDGPALWVYDIETDEAYRRRGIGREMMRLAEEHARRLGHSVIALNVFDANPGARRLYESLGYAVTRERPGAVHMSKRLAHHR